MKFELNTIDWNGISAIATTLALVIAYATIIVSNRQERKNREFQLKLMRKDFEQRNLDEFINTVIEIYREREMRQLESDFDKAVKRLRNKRD